MPSRPLVRIRPKVGARGGGHRCRFAICLALRRLVGCRKLVDGVACIAKRMQGVCIHKVQRIARRQHLDLDVLILRGNEAGHVPGAAPARLARP